MFAKHFDKLNLDYSIEYKTKKNIAIYVDINGVRVTAPHRTSIKHIEDLLLKKSSWILKKLHQMDETKQLVTYKEFTTGEEIPYLDNNYPLVVTSKSNIKKASLSFQNSCFTAEIPDNYSSTERKTALKQLLIKWYKTQGKNDIQERLKYLCPKLGKHPSKVTVKEQKTLWGSCNPIRKTININWRILMAPIEIVDYIIVHELAHLHHPNHSPEFWRTVSSILPDYKERRSWLKKHGITLDLHTKFKN